MTPDPLDALARPWGCPKCHHQESWVIDTARDEEGFIVRLRRCTLCGTRWGSEERQFAASEYWTRAHSRNVARLRQDHAKQRKCTRCGQPYYHGRYMAHVANSKRHEDALMKIDRDRLKARRYGRQWARRHAA